MKTNRIALVLLVVLLGLTQAANASAAGDKIDQTPITIQRYPHGCI